MDAYEATLMVFSRIQKLDPVNAAKIVGLLLIQDHGEEYMIRLAFGSETLLHSVVLKALAQLGLLPLHLHLHHQRPTLAANPAATQIYLTFPADSPFTEDDVSSYFSIYGPVLDVRIPYQQKRMFGFVTFAYPETVTMILEKGNPHFVGASRVLVKPYKEKGKVPYKKPPLTPQQQQLGNSSTPHALLSLEELQAAIELQQKRFMDLRLFNVNNRNPAARFTGTSAIFSDGSGIDDEGKSPNLLLGKRQKDEGCAGGKEEELNPIDIHFQEDNAEHKLPDSPFASAAESFFGGDHCVSLACSDSSNNHLIDSSTPLLSPNSTLENMASFKSCFSKCPGMENTRDQDIFVATSFPKAEIENIMNSEGKTPNGGEHAEDREKCTAVKKKPEKGKVKKRTRHKNTTGEDK